ncbi:hypothetical protein I302_101034 [Kwoniella bestiolae CBS 10118]|uniref:C3H1-type domain-containing protein n=1 Tax=Kwoniella bestiolae CBS 10118 TaxID=1296100 RepID=A0A1B9G6U5_9TREE|nr:hypothetical protein I302_04410 [Kwoniella bestiolae CBS 10118]OCF26723.1 hypothetical protein I302_04410 [Kwoniella bestiolae CBS 10118]
MPASTYSSPTPPAMPHQQRGPSVNTYKDYSKNHFRSHKSITRPEVASAGSSIVSIDDASEVDVTLNGSSNFLDQGNRDGVKNHTGAAFHERPDADAQNDLDTINSHQAPTYTADEDSTNHLQTARPRLVALGVGAINKHLNSGGSGRAFKNGNSSSSDFKTSANARGISYTKGTIRPPNETAEVIEEIHTPASMIYPNPNDRSPSKALEVYSRTVHGYSPTTSHHFGSLYQPRSIKSFFPKTQREQNLPDLTRFASAEQIAAVIAASPPATMPDGTPITRPFSLAPLPYTDDDISTPQPYNKEYPHPITAYASPRVNPETIKRSGYGRILRSLVEQDLPLTLGSRLYDAGFRDLDSSVYLLFSFEGSQGNGIPESLWSKLENVTSSRLPVGANGVSPYAHSTTSTATASSVEMPPRFAQLKNQAAMEYGMLTPPGSAGEADYFSKPINNRLPDYDLTPRPSPDYHSVRHASSMAHMRNVERPYDQQESGYQSPHQSRTNHSATSDGTATGISPFYKTELCAIWQQTGRCKYGGQCQYAHGAEELRLPRHLQNAVRGSAAAKDRVNSNAPNSYNINNGMVYPSPTRSISLKPHARSTNLSFSNTQPQARRSSCPPQQLAPLSEGIEDDHPLPLPARHQSLAIPAPIGAERSMPTSTVANTPSTRSSISSTEKWDDMPPFTLAESSHPSNTLRSEPSTMSLSLSTSSSSGYSLFTDYSEGGKTYSPIEGDITIADGTNPAPKVGYGYNGIGLTGGKSGYQANVTANTIGNGNGQSIWR